MGTWLRRLAYLLRQQRHDAELREEIEAHRSLRAAHLEGDGLSPHEALDASHQAIGNVLLARDDAREVWLGSFGTWWLDIRYGARTLRRNPAFTAVAMVTLAAGIGVNAGIFTVVNGVLFRDLSAPDAHELVSIAQTVQGVQGLNYSALDAFSTSDYHAYRDRARTLSGVLAYATVRGETTLGGDTPQMTRGVLVSCNYFDVLRQPPALGRGLAAHDCASGADPVVVLGHALWRTAFAADTGIAGRTIELNRRRFTVAGVAAEGTHGGRFLSIGYFAPFSTGPLLTSGDSRYADDKFLWLSLIGRRHEGTGPAQVRAELDVIAAQIDEQQPGRSTRFTIERAKALLVSPGEGRGAAAVLIAAFGFVLLIACANVANLLLARGTSRSPEIGIRFSLGASRARVVRQLLTESLLISIAGGVLGSVAALWSFQLLVGLAVPALLPPDLPLSIVLDLRPDVRVLAFAMALILGTGIVCGLMPALQAAKPDLPAVMKQDSAGSGVGRRGGRLRGTLVGVQVALCMALMIAAGLLLRGLAATYTVDPGFNYRGVASLSLESMVGGYGPEEWAVLQQRLVAAVEALPGVDAVARTDRDPLGDDVSAIAVRLSGQSESESRVAQVNAVSPGYFSLLGLPIVRGRTFTDAEMGSQDTGPRPVVISESTARNLWASSDPIGRTLLSENNTLHVVGVVADAQVSAIGLIDPYYVYVPGGGGSLLVRSRTDFAATAVGIRAAVRAIDPALVASVLPLEANLGWSRGISATVTALAAGLGVLALVLASVGIYGVVSYAVTGRYREFGVRMALGATARNLLGMVLRQTMRPVVVGAAIGLAGAAALSSVLSSVLFGISPADPVGLGGAALLVLGVALASGVMAARPATRADPTATLRHE